MKDIFIFSDAFTARNLSYEIEYLCNININNIYLPYENHNRNERFNSGSNVKVCICDSLDECINNSDIIIVANPTMNLQTYNNKETIFITNPWVCDSTGEIEYSTNAKSINFNKPLIAIVSIGKYTDQYCIEILVNKILHENNAKIMQFFSPETHSVINDFARAGILNTNLYPCMPKDYDVLVSSYKPINGTVELLKIVNNIMPDILIICVDGIVCNTKEIDSFLKILPKSTIIIKSSYISYEVSGGITYPVYCGYEFESLFP